MTAKTRQATRRSGSVIRRGERKWLIRAYVGTDPETGKRKYVHKTIEGTKKEADDELAKLLHTRATGGVVKPSKETVGKYLAGWLDADVKGSVSARTEQDYRAIVARYVTPHPIAARRLSQLTRQDVKRFHTDLREKGLAPRTIRYAHAVLHSAMAEAVEDGKIASNPAALKRRKRTHKTQQDGKVERELHVFSGEQARAFLAGVEADPFRALWVLLLDTGMRPGEALALRWQDVKDGSAQVQRTLVVRAKLGRTFQTPKTNGSRRSIPLAAQTVAALASHKRAQAAQKLRAGAAYQDQGLIFANDTGGPLDPTQLSKRFRRLNTGITMPDGSALPRLRMYDLRHTNATLLIAAGVPLKIVSERLGHSTITLTADTYASVLPSTMQDATHKLSEALFG